ncbi:MAG: homoserine O-succinyltransferase [Intestinibacter sp.]|uniref:homoserine O-acetyltransferase MetA n=1 Tax=Intestinibacter sp. TaxID=1965304 RepID=UPI002A835183|nr:homoserine O-succinyltransferase [Intestinibacter sp.]MDY4574310.1 homoserine O-succinyltransferase [Intestinibacter sp.]
MPLKIPKELPAYSVLSKENIFVMDVERSMQQDIRPLQIAILNLMPLKIQTENQLLRYLSNSPIQVEITLIQVKSHECKNTSSEHLDKFYTYFDDIKDKKFDGLIITGAPVELLEFEEVEYWDELVEIMEWSKKNVFSTIHICWAAQASLYHYYGIQKYELENKLSGVFKHTVNNPGSALTRGLNDVFYAPHSRHTAIKKEDILNVPDIEILSESEKAGPFIMSTKDGRRIFVTGHLEYDTDTLKGEYIRDYNKGMDPLIPENYYPNGDTDIDPVNTWRANATLFYTNWLNQVYQDTPYDINKITEKMALSTNSYEPCED